MDPLVADCPAKLNLFLAITGRRSDGFHDLVSVVVKLGLVDILRAQLDESGVFTLTSTDPGLPTDGSNLILKAAYAFARTTGWRQGAAFHVEKRIPVGAGLGGGSSNAASTLLLLNRAAGQPLEPEALRRLAAELGSDCPLFLQPGPVVMRGRGERIDPLSPSAASRLQGLPVLVFKPAFGVSTPWAYQTLAAQAQQPAAEGPVYCAPEEAEQRLGTWLNEGARPPGDLLYNGLEPAVFSKYVALPTLLGALEREFGWRARMSGSGSACFGLVEEGTPIEAIRGRIRDAWGESAFQILTSTPTAEPNPS